MRDEFEKYMGRITKEAMKAISKEDRNKIYDHIDEIIEITDEYPISVFGLFMRALLAKIDIE